METIDKYEIELEKVNEELKRLWVRYRELNDLKKYYNNKILLYILNNKEYGKWNNG